MSSPEQTLAQVFNRSRGNDLKLGEILHNERPAQDALSKLKDNPEGQARFLRMFREIHGDNPEILDRIAAVKKIGGEINKDWTDFDAIGFIIHKAEDAFLNGGPI